MDLINLLKIDVEGFEYEVLLGCNDALKKNKINKIIIEIHSEFLKSKGINEELIYTFLKEHGFNIKKIQEISSKQTSNIIAIKN